MILEMISQLYKILLLLFFLAFHISDSYILNGYNRQSAIHDGIWFSSMLEVLDFHQCLPHERARFISEFADCIHNSAPLRERRDLSWFWNWHKYKTDQDFNYIQDNGKTNDESLPWPGRMEATLRNTVACFSIANDTGCLTLEEKQFFTMVRNLFDKEADFAASNAMTVASVNRDSGCAYKSYSDVSKSCVRRTINKYNWYDWQLNFVDDMMCSFLGELWLCEANEYSDCPVHVFEYVFFMWKIGLSATPCGTIMVSDDMVNNNNGPNNQNIGLNMVRIEKRSLDQENHHSRMADNNPADSKYPGNTPPSNGSQQPQMNGFDYSKYYAASSDKRKPHVPDVPDSSANYVNNAVDHPTLRDYDPAEYVPGSSGDDDKNLAQKVSSYQPPVSDYTPKGMRSSDMYSGSQRSTASDSTSRQKRAAVDHAEKDQKHNKSSKAKKPTTEVPVEHPESTKHVASSEPVAPTEPARSVESNEAAKTTESTEAGITASRFDWKKYLASSDHKTDTKTSGKPSSTEPSTDTSTNAFDWQQYVPRKSAEGDAIQKRSLNHERGYQAKGSSDDDYADEDEDDENSAHGVEFKWQQYMPKKYKRAVDNYASMFQSQYDMGASSYEPDVTRADENSEDTTESNSNGWTKYVGGMKIKRAVPMNSYSMMYQKQFDPGSSMIPSDVGSGYSGFMPSGMSPEPAQATPNMDDVSNMDDEAEADGEVAEKSNGMNGMVKRSTAKISKARAHRKGKKNKKTGKTITQNNSTANRLMMRRRRDSTNDLDYSAMFQKVYDKGAPVRSGSTGQQGNMPTIGTTNSWSSFIPDMGATKRMVRSVEKNDLVIEDPANVKIEQTMVNNPVQYANQNDVEERLKSVSTSTISETPTISEQSSEIDVDVPAETASTEAPAVIIIEETSNVAETPVTEVVIMDGASVVSVVEITTESTEAVSPLDVTEVISPETSMSEATISEVFDSESVSEAEASELVANAEETSALSEVTAVSEATDPDIAVVTNTEATDIVVEEIVSETTVSVATEASEMFGTKVAASEDSVSEITEEILVSESASEKNFATEASEIISKETVVSEVASEEVITATVDSKVAITETSEVITEETTTVALVSEVLSEEVATETIIFEVPTSEISEDITEETVTDAHDTKAESTFSETSIVENVSETAETSEVAVTETITATEPQSETTTLSEVELEEAKYLAEKEEKDAKRNKMYDDDIAEIDEKIDNLETKRASANPYAAIGMKYGIESLKKKKEEKKYKKMRDQQKSDAKYEREKAIRAKKRERKDETMVDLEHQKEDAEFDYEQAKLELEHQYKADKKTLKKDYVRDKKMSRKEYELAKKKLKRDYENTKKELKCKYEAKKAEIEDAKEARREEMAIQS